MEIKEILGFKVGDLVFDNEDHHNLIWEIGHFYSQIDHKNNNEYRVFARLEGPYGACKRGRPTQFQHVGRTEWLNDYK